MTLPNPNRWIAFPGAALACVALALCVVLTTIAVAQVGTSRQLDAWKAEVAEIEETLVRTDLPDEKIRDIRLRLQDIKSETLALIDTARPNVHDLRKRLEQLGPPPEEGEEPQAVIDERAELTERLNKLEGAIKQLEVVALAAGQLSNRAADIERSRFVRRVFSPNHSVANPALWIDGSANVSALWQRLTFLIKSWFASVVAELSGLGWIVLSAAVGVGVVVVGPWRGWVMRLLGPDVRKEHPSDLEKIWRACCLVFLNCTSLLLALMVFYNVANELDVVLVSRMGEILRVLFNAAMLFVLTASVAYAVTSPGLRQWRLPPVSDAAAIFFWHVALITSVLYALHSLWSDLGAILYLPVELTVAQRAMIAIAVSLLLVVSLRRSSQEGIYDESVRSASGRAQFLWFNRIRGVMWLILVFIVLALLAGYIALGAFVAEQVIITGTLVMAIYLLHHLADEVMTTGLQRGWVLGDFLRSTVSLSDRGVDRVSLIVGTCIDIILLFVGLPFIVAQWAVTWIDLKSWLTTAFFGFRVGDVSISLSTVLIALSVLVVGTIITRLAVHWLDTRLLSRTSLDRGVRDSVTTVTGYAGFVIAALLAATWAGFDFTNVAIVAGALSVGIGFGLQSVVNNFVSGLILLAERPIRVGDWIAVGGEEGYVKRINVRSTVIQTFERSSVIVPNSDLIAGAVKNWTVDKMGRVCLAIGVSYDSDPEQVRDLLLACALEHHEVRRHPEPYVVFTDFGSSSLDFELRCYIVDVENILTVTSDLRFAIFAVFKENSIEIPFPQRDVNLRDIDRLAPAKPAPVRRVTRRKAK